MITTSWDDGHPADLRLAELLSRYGIPATFYIPIRNDKPVMTTSELRGLAADFEVGAHTVNHTILNEVPDTVARLEIVESKCRLEDAISQPITMFSFPAGKYSARHLAYIRAAGFRGARTVELMSLARHRTKHGVAIMPTTLQAFSHSSTTYLKNAVKRRSWSNAWRALRCSGILASRSWPDIALELLHRALEVGGVFHLWGHSWEIEELDQWQELEKVLKLLSASKDKAVPLTNSEACAMGYLELEHASGPNCDVGIRPTSSD